MSRLPMVPADTQNADLAETFESVRSKGIDVPALYRIIGNSPTLLKAWIDFAWTLRLNTKTARDLRELMIMRGAQIQGIPYEWAHHWPMATDAGISATKLQTLATWKTSDQFNQRERAVLALTDDIAGGDGASESTLRDLREIFTDEETVELILTASFYVCVSRILNSIGIELEPDYEQYVNEAFHASDSA